MEVSRVRRRGTRGGTVETFALAVPEAIAHHKRARICGLDLNGLREHFGIKSMAHSKLHSSGIQNLGQLNPLCTKNFVNQAYANAIHREGRCRRLPLQMPKMQCIAVRTSPQDLLPSPESSKLLPVLVVRGSAGLGSPEALARSGPSEPPQAEPMVAVVLKWAK